MAKHIDRHTLPWSRDREKKGRVDGLRLLLAAELFNSILCHGDVWRATVKYMYIL